MFVAAACLSRCLCYATSNDASISWHASLVQSMVVTLTLLPYAKVAGLETVSAALNSVRLSTSTYPGSYGTVLLLPLFQPGRSVVLGHERASSIGGRYSSLYQTSATATRKAVVDDTAPGHLILRGSFIRTRVTAKSIAAPASRYAICAF